MYDNGQTLFKLKYINILLQIIIRTFYLDTNLISIQYLYKREKDTSSACFTPYHARPAIIL
jgi:hypothetical protein